MAGYPHDGPAHDEATEKEFAENSDWVAAALPEDDQPRHRADAAVDGEHLLGALDGRRHGDRDVSPAGSLAHLEGGIDRFLDGVTHRGYRAGDEAVLHPANHLEHVPAMKMVHRFR